MPNDHPLDVDELAPRNFSFNSPYGACPECDGLGTRFEVDPELVVPDDDQSLDEGAIAPWSRRHVADYFDRLLEAVADEHGFTTDTPWDELPEGDAQTILLYGTRPRSTSATRTATAASGRTTPTYEGAIPYSSAATPRPRATPAASSSRATCARCRARRATAPG